jgi:ribosomal protein S18 acetylase RimI-like enzyme
MLAGTLSGLLLSSARRAREALLDLPPNAVTKNRAPLLPNHFYQLPLTSVRPKGWLARQLEIQANGLTGHLGEFWSEVGPNSAWLGGTGESWERGPYWLDGLIPLAYLLDDAKLIDKAGKWVDWTLEHQHASGQIGPLKDQMSSSYQGRAEHPQFIPQDWWPRILMLKVLTQYYEATADLRVLPVMQKYLINRLRMLSSVGCSAFQCNVDYDEEPKVGCLYVASTGILPEFQGKGLGRKQKEWQIEDARNHGFSVIATNMRQSNAPIIHLNQSLGFKFRTSEADYYHDPDEPAVVMELSLLAP